MKPTLHTLGRRQQQRGVSLFTVLVILLLSLTAVLGAFRVANLNEAMLGNSSDYNRAQAAAEALIRDAEADIRGRLPPYTTVQVDNTLGTPCSPDLTTPAPTDQLPGFDGCRIHPAAPPYTVPWFPSTSDDFDAVTDIVAANTPALTPTLRCMQGICMPLNMTDLAHIEENLAAMVPRGATYGQYTRDALGTRPALTPAGAQGNPILTSNPARAWYWVEAFRAKTGVSSNAATLAIQPADDYPFVYRITAIAQGMKPGTQVVIKSIFVPYPKNDLSNK